MDQTAEAYREHAVELRRRAARVDNADLQEQLELSARDYDELADELDAWEFGPRS